MSAIAYTVRRSERARHARLVVTPEGVELVVPRRMPLRQATSLVHDRRSWLERTLRRIATDQSEHPPTIVRDGAALPYLGSELRLRVVTQPGRKRPRVRRQGDTLEVFVGSAGTQVVKAALERWYRDRAREEIGQRLDSAVDRAGTSYTRLTIRDQKTRWASCSSTGAMSFNWRLLLASGGRARLRGRARGGSPGRARSLAALLAPPRWAAAGLPRSPGLAAPPRRLAPARLTYSARLARRGATAVRRDG